MFSDGVDTLSWLTLGANRDRGQSRRPRHLRCGAHRFAARRPRPLERRSDTGAITEATGGRRWVTDRSARIGPLLLEALADMRARYLLTYYPEPPVTPGWHELKVTLKTGRGDILTRPGYLVP